MPKRRYSDVERATALAALDANEGNVSGTAKELAIPRDTLRRWDNVAPVVQLHHEKRLELADVLESFAHECIETARGKKDTASFRDLGIVAGIATDKLIALRGGQTQGQGGVNVFIQMNQEAKP